MSASEQGHDPPGRVPCVLSDISLIWGSIPRLSHPEAGPAPHPPGLPGGGHRPGRHRGQVHPPGGGNPKDSWCQVKDGELWLYGVHISPYEKGNIFNKDPLRTRKLLMHRREILKLQMAAQRDGLTLVPLSLYFKNAKVKVELGVCTGKKLYDKRASAAERDARRDMDRAMKSRSREY